MDIDVQTISLLEAHEILGHARDGDHDVSCPHGKTRHTIVVVIQDGIAYDMIEYLAPASP